MRNLSLADLGFLGATGGIPWTPAIAAANIWLDATSLNLSDGEVIQSWPNKGSDAVTFTQINAAPTLVTSGLNGLKSADFNGTSAVIGATNASTIGITNSAIFAVFKMNSGGANEDIAMGIGTGGNTGRIRGIYRAISSTTMGFAGWNIDVLTSSLSYDIGGSHHIFGFVQNGGNIALCRDGVIANYTVNGLNPVNAATIGIGELAAGSNTRYADMRLGEVVMFYTAVSTDIRQRIEGYLAWKWGLVASLPSDHPYKAVPPTV